MNHMAKILSLLIAFSPISYTVAQSDSNSLGASGSSGMSLGSGISDIGNANGDLLSPQVTHTGGNPNSLVVGGSSTIPVVNSMVDERMSLGTAEAMELHIASSPKFDDRVLLFSDTPIRATIVEHRAGDKNIVLDVGAKDHVHIGSAFQIERPGSTNLDCIAKVAHLEKNRSIARIVFLDQQQEGKSLQGLSAVSKAFKPAENRISIEFGCGKNVWGTESRVNKFVRELLEIGGDQIQILLREDHTQKFTCTFRLLGNYSHAPLQSIADYLLTLGFVVEVPKFTSIEPDAALSSIEDTWSRRNQELMQGISSDRDGIPNELLADLRKKAEVAERRSIEISMQVRDALQSKNAQQAFNIEQLQSQFRAAVTEAFAARRDLQFMEIKSLEMKSQVMLRKLNEYQNDADKVIDRRVDDLLNPNYQWQATPAGTKASSERNSKDPFRD